MNKIYRLAESDNKKLVGSISLYQDVINIKTKSGILFDIVEISVGMGAVNKPLRSNGTFRPSAAAS